MRRIGWRTLVSALAIVPIVVRDDVSGRATQTAATSGIELLASRQISADNPGRPFVESYIAVHPRNPRHLLATAMMVSEGGDMRSLPYVSEDGGKTWARGRVMGDSTIIGEDSGDPVIYFAPTGEPYFSTLGTRRSFVARSANGGRSWRTTAELPYADRQWLAFDRDRGPFVGRIYFTGTGVHRSRDGARAVAPLLARSDDGGRTFPMRKLVAYDRGGANPDKPLDAVPLEPLVTASGLLVLTLQGTPSEETIAQARRDSLNAWAIGLIVSDDGGDSFGPARYSPTARHSVTGTSRRRLRSVSSTGYVRPAMDASAGAYRDRLYFVAADYDRALGRYVARVWHTPDFGKTWSTAIASDAPRGDVANPAIAVNRDGVVAVTWNDRRDDPNGRCWRLYAALSIDGGAHFQPAQRLSEKTTCIDSPTNWVTFGEGFNSDQSGEFLAHVQTSALVPTRFPMGGDTQGLVADGAGVFHAAWINGETGTLQLWYSSFRATAATMAARASPPAAASAPPGTKAAPAGMVDVTQDVRFRVTNTNLDFARHTYTITADIENQSGRPIRGPLRAYMRHFLDDLDNGLGLRNLRAANTDSGGPGVGALWTFQVRGEVLRAGQRTEPRVLRFTFEGGVPEFAEGYLSPGFQIFGGTTSP